MDPRVYGAPVSTVTGNDPRFFIADTLNSWSQSALNGFDRLGATYDKLGRPGDSVLSNFGSLGTGPSQTWVNLENDWDRQTGRALGFTRDFRDYVDDFLPNPYRAGNFTRIVSAAGGYLDATTGILSTAGQFHRDRLAGDLSYRGTLQTAAASTGKTAISTAVGMSVAGGLAVATGGTILLPVIVGGAAAYGAGWAYGKLTDWIRSW